MVAGESLAPPPAAGNGAVRLRDSVQGLTKSTLHKAKIWLRWDRGPPRFQLLRLKFLRVW